MRRKLSLLAIALIAGIATACATPTAPSSDECRIVTVGTQTRCEPI